MIINVADKSGIILKTSGKYCAEDIIISPKLQPERIFLNGSYTPPDGCVGFGDLIVDVKPNMQAKTIDIMENGVVTIEANNEFDGLSKVIIDVNIPVHTTFGNAEEVSF